jgi:hypothetical protein
MSQAPVSLPVVRNFGETSRRDSWWLQPTLVFLGLSAFIIYSTWAALQGNHYIQGPYLSPFYAPLLFGTPGEAHSGYHAWFTRPDWMPLWFSPAILILWAPGGFRVTCYYYRGAYYKAFWGDPPNCTVGEPRKSYWGERFLPLLLQNAHRYFLYLALAFLVLLAWDVLKATYYQGSFGVGVGTLVLLINVVLLGGYTLGCHSLRHLVGGRLDRISNHPTQAQAYRCVSCLNRGHMLWAWISLFWVGFSDFYIRMCSLGWIKDLNTWGTF